MFRRSLISLALLTFLGAMLSAEEPKKTAADDSKPPDRFTPLMPSLATATKSGDTVTLQIRDMILTPQRYNYNVTVPVTVTRFVDGQRQIVTENRQEMRSAVRNKPMNWREITLTLGNGISVVDTQGKAVDAAKVADMLKAQTPVLISLHGDPEPFFLKTVKEGTPIIIVPADQFHSAPQAPVGIQQPNTNPLANQLPAGSTTAPDKTQSPNPKPAGSTTAPDKTQSPNPK